MFVTAWHSQLEPPNEQPNELQDKLPSEPLAGNKLSSQLKSQLAVG